MIRGVVSIGTNSTRALVASFNGTPQTLLARSIGTRIGEGLKERGHLDEEPMRRTLQAMREHVAAVRELTGDLRAIATSALRRADNGAAFSEQVREITGVPLEIISGEEEARRSFIGATCGIEEAAACSFGVLDVGGGSAEYATGTKGTPENIVSCEIGAVRLTEAVPELAGKSGAVPDEAIDKARMLAFDATKPIDAFESADRIVCVGGSATTAISVLQGRRETFTYAPLTRDWLHQLQDRLRDADLESRKSFAGMNPQRADILLAGLIIIDVVLERTGSERALVSTNDLLLGTLLVH